MLKYSFLCLCENCTASRFDFQVDNRIQSAATNFAPTSFSISLFQEVTRNLLSYCFLFFENFFAKTRALITVDMFQKQLVEGRPACSDDNGSVTRINRPALRVTTPCFI